MNFIPKRFVIVVKKYKHSRKMSSVCSKTKKALKRKFFEDREGTIDQQKIRKLDKEKAPKTSIRAPKEKLGMMDMDEEAVLEKLVLGDLSSVLDKLGEDNDRFPRLIMDTEGDSGVEEGVSTPEEDDEEGEPSTSSRQPAWHDEEDSNMCIQEALKLQNRRREFKFPGSSADAYTGILQRQFSNIVGTPKWAQLEDKDEDDDSTDSDDEILQHCGQIISKRSTALPRGLLNIKKLFDLNHHTRSEGPIVTAVQFHPKSMVALVAGYAGIVSINQVDGVKNNKLHSVKFQHFPISTAKFTTDGNDFLVGSPLFPFFYRYDMLEGRSLKVQPQTATPITNFKHFQMSPDGQFLALAGRFGHIYLLCVRTGEFIANLKMNGEVTALAFNVDGSRLFSHGDSGMVYVWDVSSRTCLFQFYDDGCIEGTALALSPNGQYVATGSAQGVVNIYESSSLAKSKGRPTPAKIFYNLTTSITALSFNASSEMLAMSSSYTNNAIRLAHFPSMTVFNNFPGLDNISRAHSTDFSLHSGYFSVTNNKNTAHLFRLSHYENF